MKPDYDPSRFSAEHYPWRVEEIVREEHLADRSHHLANGAVFAFFDRARNAYLRQAPFYREPEYWRPVIAQANVTYRAEVFLGAELVIGTRVGRIGRSSFLYEQGMFEGGKCQFLCDATFVVIQDDRPVPISGSLREWMQAASSAYQPQPRSTSGPKSGPEPAVQGKCRK